jgi:hypothetical protein
MAAMAGVLALPRTASAAWMGGDVTVSTTIEHTPPGSGASGGSSVITPLALTSSGSTKSGASGGISSNQKYTYTRTYTKDTGNYACTIECQTYAYAKASGAASPASSGAGVASSAAAMITAGFSLSGTATNSAIKTSSGTPLEDKPDINHAIFSGTLTDTGPVEIELDALSSASSSGMAGHGEGSSYASGQFSN